MFLLPILWGAARIRAIPQSISPSAEHSLATATSGRLVHRAHPAPFVRLLDKYFYFCMSLLVAVVVVYGFSHTVNQNLIHANPERPWLMWVHGAVFSGGDVFHLPVGAGTDA